MSNYPAYPYPVSTPYYAPVTAMNTSTVKRAALVGAIMGAAGATAASLKRDEVDSSIIGDVLTGAVTGGLATAGVVAVGESVGVNHTLSNTAMMFLAGTALLYVMQNRSA